MSGMIYIMPDKPYLLNTHIKFAPFNPQKFRRRVFGQLWMLGLQFLLGMVLNILGETTAGAWHTIYVIVLIAHIINALGLVEGGIYIALKEQGRLAWWAAAAVVVTFSGGVLFVRTGQDAWSLAMACGFLATSWLYGMLYIRADRRVQA